MKKDKKKVDNLLIEEDNNKTKYTPEQIKERRKFMIKTCAVLLIIMVVAIVISIVVSLLTGRTIL